MIELPEQQRTRRSLDFVDTAMLGEKQNAKSFRSAAYTIGISFGFIVLSIVIPHFEDRRVADMIELIRMLAFWMLAYAAVVIFSYVKMRPQMKYVRFMLNWLLVPTIALWFVLRVMDIFSNMPSEVRT